MTEYAEQQFPAVFLRREDVSLFERDLITSLGSWNENLKAILDGGISLEDNIDQDTISFTSNAAPDTEDAIAHNLGKIPTLFIVGDIDKGGVVYRSGTAFTKTQVFLKTSTASTAVKVILL